MQGLGIKVQLKSGYNTVAELSAPLPTIAPGKEGVAVRALTGLCFTAAKDHLAPFQGRMAAETKNENSALGVTIKLLDLDSYSSDRPLGGSDLNLRELLPLSPGELAAWQESVAPLHEHLMAQATAILQTQDLLAKEADEAAA